MTDLALAAADAPASAEPAPTTAAALAARIPIPTRLPPRHDGERLRHLSNTSYTLFIACPEAWRRKNLLGERQPKSAAMVIGSRVDEALTDYYRHQLEHGEPPPVDEVLQRYRRGWKDKLEDDQERQPIVWDEVDEDTALERGAKALEVTFEQLVPQLGMPVAVQRRVEFTLAPRLEWSIVGYLDLETEWPDLAGEGVISEVVDYKVKGGNAINQATADRDPQASLYLAGRWLEGQPVERFAFAQAMRAGRKRQRTTTSLVRTQRTVGQLRATLARIALAASEIDAYYRRYGPDRPWGFADPTSWKCSERYCAHWRSCPGGAGL
jgi:PD-(D/E)XK nuclease superfamily